MTAEPQKARAVEKQPLAFEGGLGGNAQKGLPGLCERAGLVEKPREREGRVGIAGTQRQRAAEPRDARRAIPGGEALAERAHGGERSGGRPALGSSGPAGELARQLVHEPREILEGPVRYQPRLLLRRPGRRTATASA